MGLSASQCRLLLLTARRSDLELQAQNISQKRLVIAQRLEEVSAEYEEAVSNRQMKISLFSTDVNSDNVQVTRNLTYATLISGTLSQCSEKQSGIVATGATASNGAVSNSAFRLKDASGAIVVSSIDEIPKIYNNASATLKDANNNVVGIGNNGSYNIEGNDGKFTLCDASGAPVARYVVDPMLARGSTDSNTSTSGPNYLQDCLRNGKYLIERAQILDSTMKDENGNSTGEKEVYWSGISWDAITSITDGYYLEDDDAAKAKYDRLQNQLQAQDKKLELELNNIETQRSAITTEVEAVQKIIDENIENTFNTFG